MRVNWFICMGLDNLRGGSMANQSIKQQKALHRYVGKDCKRMTNIEFTKQDVFFIGVFAGAVLAILLRIRFNV